MRRADPLLRQLPNLICLLRMLLVAPIVVLLLAGEPLLALLLIGAASASDFVDGFLAKRFGWRSRLGSLLDPAADKLLLVSLFLTLTWLGLVPLWLTAVVVARDVIIVAGSLAYNSLVEPLTAEPSPIGKFNTGCQLFHALLVIGVEALLGAAPVLIAVSGAVVFVAAVISGTDYVMTWTRRSWRMHHSSGELK